MDLQRVKDQLGDLPYMTLEQAEKLASFFQEHDIKKVLELGFFHGVSTCYLAEAVGEDGHVTTIDLQSAYRNNPNLVQLLGRTRLTSRVSYYFEPECYSWRLMKFIEKQKPRFDFVYLDGGHTWKSTGFAFFLADKLLNVGGWMLFDDYNWTFDSSPGMSSLPWVRNLPAEERSTKQVAKVVDLLVRQHPNYDEFRSEGEWVFAKKVR